jgi:ketosteroid isomerase-like protein
VESSSSPVSSALALVQRGIARWNAGDYEGALEDLEPDIEWHTSGDIPGFDPVYRGHDGVRRFWRAWTEAWESMTADIEEVFVRDVDILLYARFRARGRGGLEVDQPVAFLFTPGPSGRLRRFEAFWNRDDAPLDARTSDGGRE